MSEFSTRRNWVVDAFTFLLMGIIGVLFLIPGMSYLLAPIRQKGGRNDFVDVGAISEIPKGEWKLMSVEIVHADGWRQTKTRHSIWVRRGGDTAKDFEIRSSICPHLGCPVNWRQDKNQFFCPCHGGVFDATGEKISGPPPRSLDQLECEVRSGKLFVRWQDFKIGVDKSIEVNV